jgi:hypothetical protein
MLSVSLETQRPEQNAHHAYRTLFKRDANVNLKQIVDSLNFITDVSSIITTEPEALVRASTKRRE